LIDSGVPCGFSNGYGNQVLDGFSLLDNRGSRISDIEGCILINQPGTNIFPDGAE